MTAAGVRARVRDDVTRRIKTAGSAGSRTDGAAGSRCARSPVISDMVSSAVYRYVASRDELLTPC